jgi:SAM-dependent methyltransferase
MKCLACDNSSVDPCLNLGNQPLANTYKTRPDDNEETFPLGVNLCPKCFHLQLTYFVEPDKLFKNYLYVSGTSKDYDLYLNQLADRIKGSAQNILDIGCNDGSFLNAFKTRGVATWGVDPAENLAIESSKHHNIFVGYFDDYKTEMKFDLITALNVFAHNRDPYKFLNNCKSLMHSTTRLYIQTSQANMVANYEFDTIYHEHINFFNCLSMNTLVKRAGLVMTDVFKTHVHGTSYVFELMISGAEGPSVVDMMMKEAVGGLYSNGTYTQWASTVLKFKKEIRTIVKGPFIAYGAAAKGNTLLNFTGISPSVIVDDNPLKQGLYAPGSGIPIVSSDYISSLSSDPVTFIPLAWNFFDEIKSKIVSIRPRGSADKFIHLSHILRANSASQPGLPA